MKKLLNSIFLLCGIGLVLAAFPVFGQENESGINKKPLKDFVASLKAKNIDWTKPFLVEVSGVLTKDGRFDAAQTRFTKIQGDAETVEIVKRAFEAISDSGWFGYLTNQGVKKIILSASQNSEIFAVLAILEQPTPERAKTIASGFTGLVQMALMLDKNGTKKLGDDEKKLLSGTKVTAKEKSVTINISMPAADFQEMARRRLDEKNEETTVK